MNIYYTQGENFTGKKISDFYPNFLKILLAALLLKYGGDFPGFQASMIQFVQWLEDWETANIKYFITLETTTYEDALTSQQYTMNVYSVAVTDDDIIDISKISTTVIQPFDMVISSEEYIVVRYADSDDAFNTPLGIYSVDLDA